MSRIGKKAVAIPAGVKVELQGRKVKVTGPKGSLDLEVYPGLEVKVEAGQASVHNPRPEARALRAMHGTTRALIQNMIVGVSRGFERELKIFGTGYNVKEQGGKLVLSVGYANAVEVAIPKSVKVQIRVPATRGDEIPAEFTCSGPDRQVLGQFVTAVRKVRPPEPYKGKGIRFADEVIRRKVGKAFTSAG